jgi:hypothetical protein
MSDGCRRRSNGGSTGVGVTGAATGASEDEYTQIYRYKLKVGNKKDDVLITSI